MFHEKEAVIEKLTGVKSSKKSYYTELKRTIAELERKNKKLEILSDIAKGFHVHRPIQESLERVISQLYDMYPMQRISLSLLIDGELQLQSMYPEILAPFPVGTIFPKEKSLYWKAAERDIIVIHEFDESTIHFKEEIALARINIYHLCIVPLIVKEELVGVLSFGSENRINYDISDIEFLRQLSDHLAVLVENARLYQAVLQGRDEWEQTFQAVADILILTDRNQRIVRCNKAANDFFHVEELIGRSFHELICRESHHPCPFEDSFYTNEMKNYQLTVQPERVCDIQTFPVIDETQTSIGMVIYIKDVTEKIRTQAQLQHSGKLAAIGEMAAGVAHELNSPLTAILGNTQLLKRSLGRENTNYNLVEGIERSGNRCKTTIKNLLSFSRPEKNETTQCSFQQAAEDVLSLIGFQIEREQITINKKFAPDLPSIEGSPHQIEQILINLLLNAKDALLSKKDYKRIITIETGIMEHAQEKGNYICVKDNGIGMEENVMNNIFKPFYSTKYKQKGTGLGLSVSIDIAKSHNGTILVSSKKGSGSEFTLWLPERG
ncbi:ATP-binding protein [Alteribacillus sp. YIM 98480]|uniref:ATP-binding protein n=1 Tax=Alteribacillus sp. YIM 98480 TaxID=2606599 RepID=UPI00131B5A75|nr:ATP-binding protein [Alteribacillus sp. YIM 98480]